MKFRLYYLTSWENHFEESQSDNSSLPKEQVVPYHSLVCSVLLGFSLLDKRLVPLPRASDRGALAGHRTLLSRDIFWGKGLATSDTCSLTTVLNPFFDLRRKTPSQLHLEWKKIRQRAPQLSGHPIIGLVFSEDVQSQSCEMLSGIIIIFLRAF